MTECENASSVLRLVEAIPSQCKETTLVTAEANVYVVPALICDCTHS